MLIAEVVFTVASLVTVKTVSRKEKYRPQGGLLRFHFGGGAPAHHDPFGGFRDGQIQSDRPASTPGIRVQQRPQQTVKKDKDYPF